MARLHVQGKRKAGRVEAPSPLCFTKFNFMRVWITIVLILLASEATTHNAENLILNIRFNNIKVIRASEIQKSGKVFKAKMSKLESNDNHKVVNRFGYMGKYQFGKSTLKLLVRKGYLEPVDYTEFLNDVTLQEKAMDALIKCNKIYIYKNKLNLYIGKKINTTKITMNGLLAASHLVGPFAVRRFLETDGRVNKKDGNGTSVVDYLKEFEDGY